MQNWRENIWIHTKIREPCLPYYLYRTGGRIVGFIQKYRALLALLLTHSWWENSWIHAKVIEPRLPYYLPRARFIFYIDENQTFSPHHGVFGWSTGSGDVMPQFIFQHYLRLHSEAFIKGREEIVLNWIEMVATGRPYILQQVSALCYISGKTQCCQWLHHSLHLAD